MQAASELVASGRRRHRASTRSGGRSHLSVPAVTDMLDRIGEFCFLVAVLAVPLSMAVIRETGTAVFIGSSFLMGLTWAIRQILSPTAGARFSGAEIIAFAAIGLVTLQLVSLPDWLMAWLGPFSLDYLTAWGSKDAGVLGTHAWSTISLTPSLTRSGLVLLIAYVNFFLVLRQRLQTIDDVDRCIRVVAISAIVMAVIGLAQVVTRSEQFLWVFEHPHRTAAWPAKGTFVNQNHFAHFLALGIGPLIWWWHQTPDMAGAVIPGRVKASGFGVTRTVGHKNLILGSCIAIVALAGLMSTSRGGIAVLLVAAVISMAAYGANWQQLSKLVIPTVGFVVLGSLAFGTEFLVSKWQALTRAADVTELSSGRFALWNAIAKAIPNFLPAGSGLGSHAEIYPIWLSTHTAKRFSHAENGYLQIALELGLPGLMLLGSAVILCGWWTVKGYRNHKNKGTRQRILILSAGVVISVLHSIVDFVWYLPACMILTLVTIACISTMSHLTPGETNTSTPKRRPGILPWLLILTAFPVGQLSATVASRDAGSEADWMASRDDRKALEERIDHLEQCLQSDPTDCRAKCRLATRYLQRFEESQAAAENSVSLAELRDTVRTTEFESHREVADWLSRAYGERSRDLYRAYLLARNGVQGQPLKHEGYVVMAKVGFLLGMNDTEESTLLQQALQVRPYDVTTLSQYGLSLIQQGQMDEGLSYMRIAFAREPRIRFQLVTQWAPLFSAEEFIEKMAPPADAAFYAFEQYRTGKRLRDQNVIAHWYAQNFTELIPENLENDFYFWGRSEKFFNFLGEHEKAIACLEKAVEQRPENLGARKKLGLTLLRDQRIAEARAQLEWYQLRTPDDDDVNDALRIFDSRPLAGEAL